MSKAKKLSLTPGGNSSINTTAIPDPMQDRMTAIETTMKLLVDAMNKNNNNSTTTTNNNKSSIEDLINAGPDNGVCTL